MENAKGHPMIDALIPLAALVRRELLRTLRINRSLYMLALLVGIPALCIVAIWPMEDDPVFFVHRADSADSANLYRGPFLSPQRSSCPLMRPRQCVVSVIAIRWSRCCLRASRRARC